MTAQIVALLALVGSLIVFILSTRQWSLVIRSLIWTAGALLLAVSVAVILRSDDQSSLVVALADAVHGGESAITSSLLSNLSLVEGYIVPMFNIVGILTVIYGAFALLAFTPGEVIERILRPIGFTVVGASLGGFLALGIVAIGFGGYPARQLFFGQITEKQVVDGDTLVLGGVKMRLAGIEAPEKDQTCIGYELCGEAARSELARQIQHDRVLICRRLGTDRWGRQIADCRVRPRVGGEVNVAVELARQGQAIAQTDKLDGQLAAEIEAAVAEAKAERTGIWQGCTLLPRVWRNDKKAREDFKKTGCALKDNLINPAVCEALGARVIQSTVDQVTCS